MTTKIRRPTRVVHLPDPEMTEREAEAYRAGYVVGHRHGFDEAERGLEELVRLRDTLMSVLGNLQDVMRRP